MRSRGFSLMETLAALALLGLLLLGVMTALQTMARSTHAGMAMTERLDDVRASQNYLRRALSGAVAYPWALESGRLPTVFQGQRTSLAFVASGPGYLESSGLQLQRLALVGKDGDLRLEIGFAALAGRDASPVVPGEPETLVDHVTSGHFVYSGLDEDNRPVSWRDTWPYPGRLPTMVGVELELAGGVRWPTLTVPLRMDPSATNVREGMARLMARQGAP